MAIYIIKRFIYTSNDNYKQIRAVKNEAWKLNQKSMSTILHMVKMLAAPLLLSVGKNVLELLNENLLKFKCC